MKKRIATLVATTAMIGGAAGAMVPASASADPGNGNGNGPACYRGQFNAADNQPTFDGFLKHLIYGIGCIYGVPPGQG